ncbi:MAG: transmembrane 220 family protein [Flavobacteriales bacterium]|nr:transmembrane 220 family protein [Flavobacteriales bacterium]
MKALNITLAILFLLFAAVQFNDPDPLVWMFVYGAVGTLCLLAALNGHFKWFTAAMAAVVLIWMLMLLPGIVSWVRMGMPPIVGAMKAEAPHIEVVREFLGLFIALLALVHLWRQARRASA